MAQDAPQIHGQSYDACCWVPCSLVYHHCLLMTKAPLVSYLNSFQIFSLSFLLCLYYGLDLDSSSEEKSWHQHFLGHFPSLSVLWTRYTTFRGTSLHLTKDDIFTAPFLNRIGSSPHGLLTPLLFARVLAAGSETYPQVASDKIHTWMWTWMHDLGCIPLQQHIHGHG